MHKPSRPNYDFILMSDDIARNGWLPIDLARQAGVSSMTVYRFLRGEQQTARTATKLSTAIGQPLARYLISTAAVSERRRRADDRVELGEKAVAS